MPTADEAAAGEQRADVPRVVHVSAWMWVAGGVVGLVGAILFFANRDRLVEATLAQDPQVTAAKLAQIASGLSWWLLLGSIMFLGLFVLLAHQARRGTRKARRLLVTVGIFAAFFQYMVGRLGFYGLFGLVSTLLIVVAAALMYAPAAKRFYADNGER